MTKFETNTEQIGRETQLHLETGWDLRILVFVILKEGLVVPSWTQIP